MKTHEVVAVTQPELVLQLGHSDDVRSLAFTPDGRRLISGGWDHTVKIWLREEAEPPSADRQTWTLLRTIVPGDLVNATALSPDGTLIACGSSGVTDGSRHGRVMLMDAQTADLRCCLDGHREPVRSLSFSPDGATLATGSWDGSVILWDVRSGTPRRTLPGARFVESVSFSCDGALVAAAQSGSAVGIWDVRTGELRRRLEVDAGSAGCIDAIAFSPNAPLLAVGVGGGAVFLWEQVRTAAGEAWELRHTLNGCRGRVFAIAFAPDGEIVAAADVDSVLCVWDVRRGKRRWRRCIHLRQGRRYPDHAAHGSALAFSPGGELLAVGTGLWESRIRLFAARTGARRGVLWHDNEAPGSVHFSPDGGTLAAGGLSDGTLRFWELATGELARTVRHGRDEVWLVGYSPDGSEILTSGGFGPRGIQRWDAGTDVRIGALTGPPLLVSAVACSPDGSVVAVGGAARQGEEYPGRLQLRAARTGKLLRSLRGHAHQVIAVAFSSDSRLLASGAGEWCEPGEARVWDTATGRCLYTLSGHPNQVDGVAFSPDGRLLVTAGVGPVGENEPVFSSDVRLWDVRTGDLIRAVPDSENATSPLAFSPDGTLLATRSGGQEVKLWDPESGALLRRLIGHTGVILDLSFSPDGRRLATTSLDGTMKLWDTGSGALLATFLLLPPDDPRAISTDWVTFTPEGAYTSSGGAARFIRWRAGETLLPAEQLESRYRSPDAVRRALQG